MSKLPSLQWQWREFEQLTNQQLYDLLKVRQDVFVIEQECFYPDMDGLDQDCLHLLGYDGEQLVGYLRLIPAEIHQSGNVALGRIITLIEKRSAGIGSVMVKLAMEYCRENYPAKHIQLSAQYHLVAFYEKFGFSCISEPYDEDGIMHIDMLYQQNSSL